MGRSLLESPLILFVCPAAHAVLTTGSSGASRLVSNCTFAFESVSVLRGIDTKDGREFGSLDLFRSSPLLYL